MQNYWNLYLSCKQQQLYWPVNLSGLSRNEPKGPCASGDFVLTGKFCSKELRFTSMDVVSNFYQVCFKDYQFVELLLDLGNRDGFSCSLKIILLIYYFLKCSWWWKSVYCSKLYYFQLCWVYFVHSQMEEMSHKHKVELSNLKMRFV